MEKAKKLDGVFERAVKKLVVEQAQMKASKERFEALKEKCFAAIGRYFDSQGIHQAVVDGVQLGADGCLGEVASVKVTRVQRVKLVFDADKLEKALSKQQAAQVVTKRYEVTNMPALVAYMRALDADPAVFKSFIHVEKSVNQAALDRLEELGEITASQINGCYTVSKEKPYYTAKVVGGNGE